MYVTNGTHIYHTSTTIYNVPNRKILEIETTLEYIQKQWDTPLIESYNWQQIFIWVRNHLNLPSVQGRRYNEWEIREACERRILEKSSNSDIIENLEVPNSTLCSSLNAIFLSLQYSSPNHLWGIILVGKISKKIVREVRSKINIKKKSGNNTYLLKDKES